MYVCTWTLRISDRNKWYLRCKRCTKLSTYAVLLSTFARMTLQRPSWKWRRLLKDGSARHWRVVTHTLFHSLFSSHITLAALLLFGKSQPHYHYLLSVSPSSTLKKSLAEWIIRARTGKRLPGPKSLASDISSLLGRLDSRCRNLSELRNVRLRKAKLCHSLDQEY